MIFKWQPKKESFMMDVENLWLEGLNENHEKLVNWKSKKERI